MRFAWAIVVASGVSLMAALSAHHEDIFRAMVVLFLGLIGLLIAALIQTLRDVSDWGDDSELDDPDETAVTEPAPMPSAEDVEKFRRFMDGDRDVLNDVPQATPGCPCEVCEARRAFWDVGRLN